MFPRSFDARWTDTAVRRTRREREELDKWEKWHECSIDEGPHGQGPPAATIDKGGRVSSGSKILGFIGVLGVMASSLAFVLFSGKEVPMVGFVAPIFWDGRLVGFALDEGLVLRDSTGEHHHLALEFLRSLGPAR